MKQNLSILQIDKSSYDEQNIIAAFHLTYVTTFQQNASQATDQPTGDLGDYRFGAGQQSGDLLRQG
jgi:hypothetical protein